MSHTLNISSVPINGYTLNIPSVTQGQNPWYKEHAYNFAHDALVLSCAVHRLRDEQRQHLSLTDEKLGDLITEQDRSKASSIRDYYSRKLMLLQLKTGLSKFRKDLAVLLSGESVLKTDVQTLGMIYRLPEFYTYDRTLENLYDTVYINKISSTDQSYYTTPGKIHELTPVARLMHTHRGNKTWQYWYRVGTLNHAGQISVRHDNVLKPFWDTLFDSGSSLRITGKFGLKKIDDFWHLQIVSWQLQNSVRLL